MGDSCFSFSFSFPFCFCLAAKCSMMEDEDAFLLLCENVLARGVDGGVERILGLGFLGLGVEVEGVVGVEIGSLGGEGVDGRWRIGY